jgi:hypothetical protein
MSGLGASTLPSVWHPARHECAGAGSTNRDLITNLEGDFTAQNVGDFIAIVMNV